MAVRINFPGLITTHCIHELKCHAIANNMCNYYISIKNCA